jgi:hypothetical protein
MSPTCQANNFIYPLIGKLYLFPMNWQGWNSSIEAINDPAPNVAHRKTQVLSIMASDILLSLSAGQHGVWAPYPSTRSRKARPSACSQPCLARFRFKRPALCGWFIFPTSTSNSLRSTSLREPVSTQTGGDHQPSWLNCSKNSLGRTSTLHQW